ncbi:MAG: cupredoxin domain-containing protein [Chloroflexota bacterium]|nr:cupredoxin domain-containing protein [Chloroflexota bacterium]
MNLTRTTARAAFALMMIGLTAVVFGACANSSPAEPTPVTTFAITPAPPNYTPPPVSTFAGGAAPAATAPSAGTPAAQPTAATSPAGTPAATAPASGTPAAGTPAAGGTATTLKLVAENILFDKSKLTAPAGTITIDFDNKDGGIPHNLKVFKGTDASGPVVGATAVATGPVQQTLTLKLAPGTYYYHCDVHPATMTGILTVT